MSIAMDTGGPLHIYSLQGFKHTTQHTCNTRTSKDYLIKVE